ncbi:unnamed protein product [Caenorhabditis angaria]|uniref:Transmembrane protein 138 n=1 Tax=Caenorhabditis angaria TaxID=860376 RepID=A0A9P1IAB0_9PELO|nr:unnamed protein product [Caenorhabditis angaria]
MGSKYALILYTQIALLIIDIIFNSVSVLLVGNNTILLMLYILQDTFLVMSCLVLMISFSSTFIFQIGLIPLIFTTFLPTIFLTIFYTLISIGYHYASLNANWDDPSVNIFQSIPLTGFYIFHKFLACFYYSFYKRAALHISDPKYNQDSDWLRSKFMELFSKSIPNAEEVRASDNKETLKTE